MTERRASQRYELSLPIMVCLAQERPTQFFSGQVLNISTTGVYFELEEALAPGTELLLTLSLPIEITRGQKVLVRASGRVLRVDTKNSRGAAATHGIASCIERYDIIRPKASSSAVA
jgi:PilZ domain